MGRSFFQKYASFHFCQDIWWVSLRFTHPAGQPCLSGQTEAHGGESVCRPVPYAVLNTDFRCLTFQVKFPDFSEPIWRNNEDQENNK